MCLAPTRTRGEALDENSGKAFRGVGYIISVLQVEEDNTTGHNSPDRHSKDSSIMTHKVQLQWSDMTIH